MPCDSDSSIDFSEMPNVPAPAIRWEDAVRIVGEHGQLTHDEMLRWGQGERIVERFYNDFCLVRDRAGRWHHIGHLDHGDTGFAHYVGDTFDRPFSALPGIQPPVASGVLTWSPFVIWKNETTALMFYSNFSEGSTSIRILESVDDLATWRPVSGRGLNLAFEEPGARDPCVLWDEDRGSYLMYYVSAVDGNSARVRESSDLLAWSEPSTVMSTPPGYGAAESVFVVKRDRFYYLWVSGFDYGLMSLYLSEDPLDFGDAVDNRIAEQSGHAPEIVRDDHQWWIACSAISSRPGYPPGPLGTLPSAHHDLPGVYIQPLHWMNAKPKQVSRIKRTMHSER